MKFCASCGSPLNDEKFCPKCGTQVSGEAPENIAGSGLEKKPQKMVPASKKLPQQWKPCIFRFLQSLFC